MSWKENLSLGKTEITDSDPVIVGNVSEHLQAFVSEEEEK